MITVRPNTFETNSSSMHALVIDRGYSNILHIKTDLVIDASYMFDVREYHKRETPEEKAAWMFQIVINAFNSFFIEPPSKYVNHKIIYGKFSKKDIEHNEKVIKAFENWMKEFKDLYTPNTKSSIELFGFKTIDDNGNVVQHYDNYPDINISFKGFKIRKPDDSNVYYYIEMDGGYHADMENVLSHCCPGLAGIDSSGIERFENGGFDKFVYHWFTPFIDMVYNPKTVFFQGSDEMPTKEVRKQLADVKKAVKSSNFDCNLEWFD